MASTTTVKSEEKIGGRTRCVKRRRRDAADEILGCDDQPTSDGPKNGTTTTVKRSSRFRGVSKHRWTGRYEAHLWDKLSWNVTQKKKGKQGMLQLIVTINYYIFISFIV